MLRDHEHERKVVHAESEVKQFVGVTEEDDVFDGIFGTIGIFRCFDSDSCQYPRQLVRM